MAENEKKISMVEAILMLMVTVTADIAEVIADLTLIGIPISILINVVAYPTIQFWLIMKGIRNLTYTAGSMIEFIPIINALPVRTATMIMTIFLANRPVVAKLASAGRGRVAARRPKTTTLDRWEKTESGGWEKTV
ncbi:MAG: hypothetical protein HYS87_01395 [Candidatus Colwellbacteria bacterium]|nr:hypothetical protein [Candidatus Colwellbacteria bacterium]